MHSPGGGGYGDPLARDVAAVVRDVRDELVSVQVAEHEYGVVLMLDSGRADLEATTRLRTKRSDTTGRMQSRESSAPE
jgi:N-methylhydantoinase B